MIDLHCHTAVSDSSLSIEETIDLAQARGVNFLAITDHDTTAGIESALAYAMNTSVTVIPGIEISAYDFTRNRRAHILGLYVKPDHPALVQLCQPLLEQRHEANYQAFQRILAAGYALDWKSIQRRAARGTGVYKQHIMQELVESGYCESIYGSLYKQLFRGGIAHIPLTYVDVRLAIQAVRDAGGVPVLAHPGQMGNYEAVEEFVRFGLAGIEAYHPDHSSDDEQRTIAMAEQFGLIITGGSDYHGANGHSHVQLGEKSPGAEVIQQLQDFVQKGTSA